MRHHIHQTSHDLPVCAHEGVNAFHSERVSDAACGNLNLPRPCTFHELYKIGNGGCSMVLGGEHCEVAGTVWRYLIALAEPTKLMYPFPWTAAQRYPSRRWTRGATILSSSGMMEFQLALLS